MQRLESLVTVCLDHLGWAPCGLEADPAGGRVRTELSVRFGGRRCSASIDTWEDADAVVFAIYAPFTVHPERFEQACLLLNALGGATVWGCFRLDADDGMLSYDATARFPASDACGPEGVWNLLRNGLGEFERWFPALEQLATTGRSAQEILAADADADADVDVPASATASDAQADESAESDERTDQPADDFVSYEAAAGLFLDDGKEIQ